LFFGISGYIDLAKQCVASQERVTAQLEKTSALLNRSQTLTRQLLTFAKGGEPHKKILLLTTIVRDMTQLALSGSNVSCTFSFPDNLWTCEADEGQMNQVIEHVVINARQAMPDGGVLNVEAVNYVLYNNRFPFLQHGNYVKIIIRDNGHGIAPENLPKIFDPFFTTYKNNNGLGLTISYSILRKHNGYIDVQSKVGAGTTFYLYIPAKEQKPIVLPINQPVFHRGEGRILVMDDEDFVRDILNTMLHDMGYTVELASHGEEAVGLYKQSIEQQCPFCAVILDMTVLAGMGGKETVQEMRKLCPNLIAIASSGYSDDPVMASPTLSGFNDKICKPYNKKELSRVLARVLPAKTM
jgi:two-component system, cell cycle sensor histidine kinase and response regulator CckA